MFFCISSSTTFLSVWLELNMLSAFNHKAGNTINMILIIIILRLILQFCSCFLWCSAVKSVKKCACFLHFFNYCLAKLPIISVFSVLERLTENLNVSWYGLKQFVCLCKQHPMNVVFGGGTYFITWKAFPSDNAMWMLKIWICCLICSKILQIFKSELGKSAIRLLKYEAAQL